MKTACSRSVPNRVCQRCGAVTVEFAFVGVLIFLFFFAGVEFSRVNMIRNTIENASYEGARTGIIPGATNSECVAAAQSYLDIIGISTATITVTPANLDSADDVTVTVTVPMDGSNGYVLPSFLAGQSLHSTITLPRE